MKVGTITTHTALNYGAVLQAYALCRYIGNQGLTCEVMDYCPEHVTNSYRLVTRLRKPSDVPLALFQMLHYRERNERSQRFAAFRNEMLPLSDLRVKNHGELIELANTYDLLVCGSDQIWSPVLHQFDEAYFLSFPEIRTRRASYAASFGQDEIEASVLPEMRRRLSTISDFACREYTGKKLVEELTGKAATMVLDPVFLLSPEEWRRLAKPVEETKPYDLVYFLSNPGKSPFAAKHYAQEQNEKVLSIGFSPRDARYGVKTLYSLGPQEFLGAIDEAHTVLTNSFHCTAFAILFEKPFYTRISSQKGSRNDRMISLLKDLGLEDRLYTDDRAMELDFSKEIDYAAVRERLMKRIDASRGYLESILKCMTETFESM